MKLHYFTDAPNFGDALNPWLWPRLLGDALDDDSSTLLLGIGTILTDRVPPAETYHVLGAGAGYHNAPRLDARWHVHAVRGPLTAQALGLGPEYAATDAAYLLRTVPLPEPKPGPAIGFMPHFRAMPHTPWRWLCEQAGVHYIDPLWSVDDCIAAVRGCDCLIAEAMHGAIVADVCRVPWLPVTTGGHVLDFKWRDWLLSVELEYHPRRLASLHRVAPHRDTDSAPVALARRALNAAALGLQLVPLRHNLARLRRQLARREITPFLSSDNIVRLRTDQLARGLESLRTHVLSR
jgi:succinoglycan biosynthesis protein ExoV